MATTIRSGAINKCRRGDIIAWAERRTYTFTNMTSRSETVYTIGIVKSVTRDGLVKTADTGSGTAVPVYHNIESRSVRGEDIDAEKARAWLTSDDCYPNAAGSQPLRSMDDVRSVVRQWFRA